MKTFKMKLYEDQIIEVAGYPINLLFGLKGYISRSSDDFKTWSVTEESTGLKICNAPTKREAFEKMLFVLNKIGEINVLKTINDKPKI